jgi:amino acid adenylation domain-containing protein
MTELYLDASLSSDTTFPPAEEAFAFPLSFAQQRLWFLDQLEPGRSIYNIPMAVRLTGRLNVDALEQTLTEIRRRHESLRTRFDVRDGEPVQIISSATSPLLEVSNLSELSDALRDAEVQRAVNDEMERPFDLQRGPLLRVRLLRLREEEHVLLLTMHHIISDGWSMSVLISEVAALYSAYSQGQDSPLAELQIQYADFAVWQRQWLESGVLERQLSYWREQLGGHLPLLELPTDYPRPLIQSYRGAQLLFHLSPSLSDALRALARSEGVTLFMLLLAAWQTLLSRYSGQTDIIVGTDVANRNRIQTESLIGFFVNQLVLRSDLSGNPSFRQLLQRVREVCLAAYEHQDVPFEKLVEELQPERSLSLSPLYQVMFVLQNAPQSDLHLPGLELSALSAGNQTAKFDLVMTMVETGAGMSGAGMSGMMEYSTDLFAAESVRRMAEHYEQLLESVVGGVEQRVGTLNLLTERERAQVLEEWNETARAYPRDCTVTELFEAEVMKRGEARAVTFGERHLTYGELNARANQLAHYLRSLGVGPEVLVGICVERSVEMVVGLLAILKAGGAYLPLDPSYPQERLSFMMEDAQAQVLLTEEALMERMPAHWGQTLCLDSEWEQVKGLSEENVGGGAGAENLAYIIYTSGSTGKPKGVCVTHRAIVRLVRETDYVQVRADDVMGQASNNSFDAATFEMWGALLNGARLCGVSKEVLLSPRALAEQIKEERLTVMFLTTALFNQVAQTAPEAFTNMRAVLFGGQAVDVRRVRDVLEAGYTGRLLHVYGPTECTTYATWHEVVDVSQGARTIPIGRPLANTRAYILDESQQVLPIGIPGELYLAGDGLARAYRERPDLTAEKFIPDAFSREAGARLYRTGDVVRYDPDGLIEFIGRVDQQVKIRGFRIELGEIEAVMQEQGWVSECVVLAVEQEGGEKQLVAYVVMGEGQGESRREMREGLKEKLPEYMIPSLIVEVEEMPLTENGKVDRKALAGMERVESRGDEEAEGGARTAIEELIASIYGEVLEKEEVRCDESFFEMGGHSLLATQVISRVREVLGVEVALRTLFERPSVGEMSEEVERLRAAARSATEGATEGAGEGESGAGPATIVRVEREDGARLPLSYAQQRLWFVEQLEPGLSTYNVPVGVRLRGQLDVSALERTLSEIVRRHEVLRTSFEVIQGEANQVIGEAQEMRLEVEDLSGSGEAEAEMEAERIGREEAGRGFELSGGRLMRVRLLRVREDEHVLLLTMHHIVVDGWSLGVLVKELAALYEAFIMGEPSPLAELQIQYADFAVWQRGLLGSGAMDEHLQYWKRQLAGAPSEIELPTDRTRPAVQTYRGAHEARILSPALTRALKDLSRRQGVTLFMTLLATWQTLLSRYTGQEDIVVGTDVANRNRVETEDLVGFFVNMLVMRTDLSGDPGFTELLRRVRETCLDAYAHQDLPFEKLVEELQPERSLSHSPLFQVVFGFQNAPQKELKLRNLELSAIQGGAPPAKFNLSFGLREVGGVIGCELSYNTDLFDAATINRMLVRYERLLEEIVKNPEQSLSVLPLLSEDERQEVMAWNETTMDYPRESCVHQLFEAQAERAPDAVAVTYDGQQVSYGELNRRANQVAHYLRSLGVGPEVLVGLCVERSIEMVVGLLGVLKAGGSYLPLDPAYPSERLSFMLEDAQVPVLLTQGRALANLPPHQARVVCLDTDWQEIARAATDNPQNITHADNLAYTIYTSGSTGKPKGVLITHRAVVNHNHAIVARYKLSASDRVLQFASLSFDVAVEEMFPTWLSGGTVVLRTEHVLDSHRALIEFLERERITAVNLSTPYWAEVMSELSRLRLPVPPALRLAAIGGEKAAPEQFAMWQKLLGERVRLMNAYGPTETTVTSTSHELDFQTANDELMTVPLGYPIGNTRLFVLDRKQQLVPVGIEGELYIGGESLARGYLHRAGQTAEKFIPDPFSGETGARLYRTGDLVRYLADGQVEFLGRVDHQVKVRGFRIELGEIESVLRGHGAIREAVVIVREDVVNDKRVVAYLVALDREQPPASVELRRYLKERLPEYMVPSSFVMLEEIPLTPSSKVDRKALPAPHSSMTGLPENFVEPRTPAEEILAGIWSDVLGVGRVGADDNFFALGGHSLLATQVISRVREAFRQEVPLRRLFEYSTLADFARSLELNIQGDAEIEAPLIKPVTHPGPLPLSFAQQRLWFLDQLEPGSSINNMPFAVRLNGYLDLPALEQTLNEIIRRHEVLRTTFISVEGEPRQIIHEAQAMKLALEDLSASEDASAEAGRVAKEEAGRGFDLSEGPLLRARLLRLSAEEHVVLLTMHHIICDGWSMGILINEIAALYQAYVGGLPSPLAELPVQYADFAVWQREWLQGDVMEKHLGYWRRKLGGAWPTLELPTDRPRPPVQTYRGAGTAFLLTKELAEQLRDLSRREGVTLFMTMLSAFQILLHRYTRQKEIVIGADVANRTRIETESLIGYFVNLLVLRTDLSQAASFRDVLRQVRETTLEAYAHQDVPFEKIVEELQPRRDLSRHPLVQVCLSLQNAPAENLTLPGLTLRPFDNGDPKSKWDLALFISESGEQIAGAWKYNPDLFDASTIERLSAHFETLLKSILAAPDARLAKLEFRTEAERSEQQSEKLRLQKTRFSKFKKVAPEPDSVLDEELVRTGYLDAEGTLPLVVRPAIHDFDILDWTKNNRELLQTNLRRDGAMLFRGCRIKTATEFEQLAHAVCPELFGEYGDLPREGVSHRVYGSTPYPQDQAILFHNESSHLHHWPLNIFFYCVTAAEQGGETPLVDCRKLYARLDPKIRERLAQKRLMYVRNFTDGLDVNWQSFFQTTDRAVVEEQCRRAFIEVEWKDGNRLRTRRICQAVARHPKTSEMIFFNQILLHHVMCLEPSVRESMFALFGEEDLPRQVYYGDGTPIEASIIEEILELYWQTAVKFPWQEGDVLAVDNMLVAHARMPFAGPRKILVAMGEMVTEASGTAVE